ncbi:hypothetical protein MKW92_014113 [Papaver armeniacum]|nr:hypothetical protein MKW92_014113 [Papaver armeniacum]
METHFLSSLVKKSKTEINLKHIGNDMWDVAMERRYTKLVQKLHMLSSSLYLRQVKRRTRRSVVCEAASAKKAKKIQY